MARPCPSESSPRSSIVQPMASSPAAMIILDSLSKSFGTREVLKGVSLEVRRGEVVCIIGPSGSGKTTFLRCLNHLERIDGGRIEVDGELVGYRERPDGTRRAPRRTQASGSTIVPRQSGQSSGTSTHACDLTRSANPPGRIVGAGNRSQVDSWPARQRSHSPQDA